MLVLSAFLALSQAAAQVTTPADSDSAGPVLRQTAAESAVTPTLVPAVVAAPAVPAVTITTVSPVTVPMTPAQQAGTAALNTVTLRDVPANHWAVEAVKMMVQQGYVTGFPDGTFRGNQLMTRYQAAVLLARALQNANLGNLSTQQRLVLQKGVDSVASEIQVVQGQIAVLSSSVTVQAAQIAELNTVHAADVSRIAALEAQSADTRAQLTALAAQMALDAADSKAARAAASAKAEAAAIAAATAALGTASSSTPAATADVSKQPDVTFTPKVTPPSNLKAPQFGIGVFGTFGGLSLTPGLLVDYHFGEQGGFGLQGQAAFSTGSAQTTTFGLNATYTFNSASDLRPYVLAGGGINMGESWTTTGQGTDVYASVGAGADYAFASTLTLFADASLRHYFSNNSAATGLPQDASGGNALGGRLGLKLHF